MADTPPDAAVETIAGVLHDTDGDLGAASIALLHLDQAWVPLAKLRTPLDFSVATLRALDLPADKQVPLQGVLGSLGQPLWTAPLPNGWADVATDWAAPEAMMRRVDWTYSIAGRAGDRDPHDIAESVLGPLLKPRTAEAMKHAGSRRDALTLLLTSPEFQRR